MPKRSEPKVIPDRLPPHSAEAEAGWLSCVLQDQNVIDLGEEAGLLGEWFYDLRHQLLFAATWELAARGQKVDVITTGESLKSKQQLDQVGGFDFLTRLADLVPSSHNAPAYLEVLREKWIERAVVRICTDTVTRLYGKEPDVESILGGLQSEITRVTSNNTAGRAVKIGEEILRVMADLEDYHRGHAQIRGLTTGLEYNDKLLGGIGGENGNYIVLSARPGMGKTSLAMQIALHVALDHVWFTPVLDADEKPLVEKNEKGEDRIKLTSHTGLPVHIFSLEMTGFALCKRMLFQRARADMQRWRTGFAKKEDFEPLTKAASQLRKAPVWVDDAGRCTIEALKAKARAAKRDNGVGLFIVDYIQLLRTAGNRFREDRVQELAEISAELAALGKELATPFVVLAQMNRDYEKDPNRAPRLSDLKDCGSIEQDADLVGFLYSPKKANDSEEYKNAMEKIYEHDWSAYPTRVDLLWQKNRYGPTGPVQLLFQRSSTIFHDWKVWLKSHDLLPLAAGEESLYKPQNQPPKDSYADSIDTFPRQEPDGV